MVSSPEKRGQEIVSKLQQNKSLCTVRKKDERKEQKPKANALNYGFNLSNSTFGSNGEFSLPIPSLIKGSYITHKLASDLKEDSLFSSALACLQSKNQDIGGKDGGEERPRSTDD